MATMLPTDYHLMALSGPAKCFAVESGFSPRSNGNNAGRNKSLDETCAEPRSVSALTEASMPATGMIRIPKSDALSNNKHPSQHSWEMHKATILSLYRPESGMRLCDIAQWMTDHHGFRATCESQKSPTRTQAD